MLTEEKNLSSIYGLLSVVAFLFHKMGKPLKILVATRLTLSKIVFSGRGLIYAFLLLC